MRLRFLARSTVMAAPPVAPVRDALARFGILTGLFACLFARHFLRRVQVRALITCSVL